MNSVRKDNFQINAFTKYAVVFIAAALAVYNILRAYLLDITHDESFTFNQYVRAQIGDIVKIGGSNSNNHVLSTIVIKLFYLIFGSNWLILRLPAVLGYCVYQYFSYRLVKTSGNYLIVITGFLLLNLNPFLFDFFSLARGYAPALACTVASLWYAMEYVKNHSFKLLLNALILSALAVFFHLSFLNYFIPLCAMLFLYIALRKNASNKVKNLLILLVTVIGTVAYALPVSLHIKQLGEMDLAGKNGFWNDTAGSILHFSTYMKPYFGQYNIMFALKIAVLCITVLAIFFTVFYIYKHGKKCLQKNLFFVVSLLVTMVVSIQLQHYLLGNRFPDGRLALYFVPVFMLVLIYLFSNLAKTNMLFNLAPAALTILMGWHFINSLNLKYCINWIFDADTREMMADVKNFSGQKDSVNIGASWLFEPSINYYRINDGKSTINAITREGYLPIHEYFYCLPDELSLFDTLFVTPLKKYSFTKNILLKNNIATSLRPFYTAYAKLEEPYVEIPAHGSSNNILLDTSFVSKYLNDSFIAVATAWVLTENDYVGGNLVISVDDENKKPEIWKSGKVSDAVMVKNEWQKVQYACIMPGIKNKNRALNSYLWNTAPSALKIKLLKLELYSYKSGSIIYAK